MCGEVTEWLKVHAWKACVGKPTEGSNPSPSANQEGFFYLEGFLGPSNIGRPRVRGLCCHATATPEFRQAREGATVGSPAVCVAALFKKEVGFELFGFGTKIQTPKF